jgi:three-Cys-motif partner protein
VTQQLQFGGSWTQQKLDALSKYLRAYTIIFQKNPRARFFTTSYVDAFAGTGEIPTEEPGPMAEAMLGLAAGIEEYRKGSVMRALEVEPPFHKYVFIEKDSGKCNELAILAKKFPTKDVRVINEDANSALLDWCDKLDGKHERAVVFLDPFGASVEWRTIVALANTRAVDLWILFPYFAVNRMLIRHRKPPEAWANRLTKIFGTADWEGEFYRTLTHDSILDPRQQIEEVYKTADSEKISQFFVGRLGKEFEAVSEPLALYSSRSLLFLLYFAAGNQASARTGMKIANSIVDK